MTSPNLRSEVAARAAELEHARVPFVHARVVLAERPTSAKPGDEALVLADGTMEGFVGGTCAESTVRAQAMALLDSQESLLLRITNEKTAMMLFYNANNNVGQIKDEEFAQLGKQRGIPTLNDAAADVPPVENLWKYTKMGFDLVAFSGGKGIRGPQSAGLLLGRKDSSRRRA